MSSEYTISMIITLTALAGVVSWGAVQFVKNAVIKYRTTKGRTKDPGWYWNSMLRTLAVVVGCFTGWLLAPSMWGIVIGFCAGVLNTTMVKFVKAKLKSATVESLLGVIADENDEYVNDENKNADENKDVNDGMNS